MIAHGDEIGRTQRGNNNVYCQDSELSWMDWSLCETNADLLEFTRRVIKLRKSHPVFRRRRFFEGKPIRTGDQVRDIAWLTPAGKEMTAEDWDSGLGKCVAVFLNGDGHPGAERARRTGRRRLVPAVLQRARQAASTSSLPTRRLRQGMDGRARHRRPHRVDRAGRHRRREDLAAGAVAAGAA